jgi:Fur family ferric uptake transcriptional regulator
MAPLATTEVARLLGRFREYLESRRLPITRPRLRVAGQLLAADAHLSVEELQQRLDSAGEPVSPATIYRTLELLEASGLAQSHDFGQGYRRYEPSPASEHHHLICDRCGCVTEFTHERLDRLLPLIADEHGYQARRHRLEIYGTCRGCRRAGLG